MRFLSVVVPWGALLAVLVAACGGIRDERADAAAAADASGSTADAALEPSSTTYAGMLDAIPAVPFGGPPYCEYTITLEEVGLEVEVSPSGQVIGAEAGNLSTEGTLPPCTDVIPPTVVSYNLATATRTDAGARLMMRGAPGNVPLTTLTIELARAGDGFEAELTWKRTDQPPPLDWVVTAAMTLSARSP
jgi:hypothetical protein